MKSRSRLYLLGTAAVAKCKTEKGISYYRDGEYTVCSACTHPCEGAERCCSCGVIAGVFYKGPGHDAFYCAGCLEAENRKRYPGRKMAR